VAMAQDPLGEKPDAAAAVGWGDAKAKAEAVDPAGIRADRMTLRQRRELGLTVANVRRVVKDLEQSGQIEAGTDPATVSLMVAGVLMEENQAVYSGLPPAFDWDKFMEFVERIVELVMKIIGLFSYHAPAGAETLAVAGGPPVGSYGPPVMMAA